MCDADLKKFMQLLCDKDEHLGYMAMSMLILEIGTNPKKIYHYVDLYYRMLDHRNPTLRSRGLSMIAACAEIDYKNKIRKNIRKVLKHTSDPSPIVARECLKILPTLVKADTSIANGVFDSLLQTDISKYELTMQTFMQNEVYKAIKEIEPYRTKIVITESTKTSYEE